MGNTGNGINIKNILTFNNYEKQLIIEKSDQQTMTHEPDLALQEIHLCICLSIAYNHFHTIRIELSGCKDRE